MKLAANRIEGFLRAPDAAARVILVYGPDAGLAKERLDRLTKTVCNDLHDPFRLADLSMAGLKDDPSRLADEAAAIAMTGGRRVVRLRDAGDGATAVVQSFLAHPAGDALVLIEAGELGPRSTLRKLVEAADNAVALPCYADEGGALEAVIHETLRAHDLTAEPDAVAWLADHLGGDRLLTRSELDKLALYMGGPGRVRLEDAAHASAIPRPCRSTIWPPPAPRATRPRRSASLTACSSKGRRRSPCCAACSGISSACTWRPVPWRAADRPTRPWPC